jgi:hypothetical protein
MNRTAVIFTIMMLLAWAASAQLTIEAGAARTEVRGSAAATSESLYSPAAGLRWHHRPGKLGYSATATWLMEGARLPEAGTLREHTIAASAGFNAYLPTAGGADDLVFFSFSAYASTAPASNWGWQYGPQLGWHFQVREASFSLHYRIGMRYAIQPHVLFATLGIPLLSMK